MNEKKESSNTENKKRKEVGLIMRANRLHHNAIEKKMKSLNIHRSQHMILMCVSRANADVSQKDIAEKMQITPAAVAMTLKKLEQNGYIYRESDEKDGRVNRIAVSEKGENVVRESEKVFMTVDEAMFENIEDEKLSVFVEVMEKINENLLNFGAEDKREKIHKR